MKPRIYQRDYGIADCVSDKNKTWIEINKNLKKYPKLYREVLNHELEHSKSKKLIDWDIELKDSLSFKHKLQMYNFILTNPKSLLHFLPVLKTRKGYAVNWFFTINYAFLTGLFIIILKTIGG